MSFNIFFSYYCFHSMEMAWHEQRPIFWYFVQLYENNEYCGAVPWNIFYFVSLEPHPRFQRIYPERHPLQRSKRRSLHRKRSKMHTEKFRFPVISPWASFKCQFRPFDIEKNCLSMNIINYRTYNFIFLLCPFPSVSNNNNNKRRGVYFNNYLASINSKPFPIDIFQTK